MRHHNPNPLLIYVSKKIQFFLKAQKLVSTNLKEFSVIIVTPDI
jgi:hypothetical protein